MTPISRSMFLRLPPLTIGTIRLSAIPGRAARGYAYGEQQPRPVERHVVFVQHQGWVEVHEGRPGHRGSHGSRARYPEFLVSHNSLDDAKPTVGGVGVRLVRLGVIVAVASEYRPEDGQDREGQREGEQDAPPVVFDAAENERGQYQSAAHDQAEQQVVHAGYDYELAWREQPVHEQDAGGFAREGGYAEAQPREQQDCEVGTPGLGEHERGA